MTPRIIQRVHSGRYLIKTRASSALTIIWYACCIRSGAFQCIDNMPMQPKFHIHTASVK